MNVWMLILFIVSLGILLFGVSTRSRRGMMTVKASSTKPHIRAHAEARITVQSSRTEPYGQTPSPVLMEVQIDETFTGDIDGKAPVRALQVLHNDKPASLVSVQR